MSMLAIYYNGWELIWNSSHHANIGIVLLFTNIALGLFGILTWAGKYLKDSFFRRAMNKLKIFHIHRALGYLVIALS